MSQPDVERPWRFAHASAIGRSHVASGTPCQDASASELLSPADAPTWIGVVCDGAGSAPLAHFGARFACQMVVEEARAALACGGGVAVLDRDFALTTLERFQHALLRLARRLQRTPRDFACTLLFAAADERAAVFCQIGDGAIVVSPGRPRSVEEQDPSGILLPDTGFDWVFWPEQGEYLNQTYFASETSAEEHLRFERRDQRIDEIALFSDGLQNLVLDQRRRIAHARFFEPMFVAMRWAGPGRSDSLSSSLERFLCSRAIESRTDDDKSLVLASRREPAPRPPLPAPAPPGPLAAAHMPRELYE